MRLVRDRDYFVCDYCRSYFIPDPNRDGVRILHEPGNLVCPVCESELVVAALDRQRLLHCPNCKGNLIDQAGFARTADYLRQHSDIFLVPPPIDIGDLKRPLNCPNCHRQMDTHPYGGPGNIVIDNCRHCHLVWLDFGELFQIITAIGADRASEELE